MTGQSTFFVELAETAAMLHKATNRYAKAFTSTPTADGGESC
jgi:hypothetical protein